MSQTRRLAAIFSADVADPEQENFADGMVEEIIRALSRIRLAVRDRPQFELYVQGAVPLT